MNPSYKTPKNRGGGNLKSSFVVILSLYSFFLFSVLAVEADDKRVLYSSGSYTFTQKNANELIELAEFLGRSKFSSADKKALQIWSIQDFKSVPKKATVYYKDLNNNLMPKIRAIKNKKKRDSYRTDLYLGYVNLFNKKPEYKASPDNFVAVIDRYNPPVAEAMLLQQQIYSNFQQQLRLNQMMFNQTMKLQQESADLVTKSIRDQATRYSITVPGGTILHETDSKIYAKDHKGNKFEVLK